MHTVIYLTGSQQIDKNIFVSALRNVAEIKFNSLPPLREVDIDKLKEQMKRERPYCETICITENIFNPRMQLFLRNYAENKGKNFLTIKL